MNLFYGTLVYLVITFPLAVVWHMKIFRAKYMAWGYFGEDVKPVLGLCAMSVQGVVLSYGYLLLKTVQASILSSIGYAVVMGLFLWSAHVLAAMGKSAKLRHVEFFAMETVYLLVQFVLYGMVMYAIM